MTIKKLALSLVAISSLASVTMAGTLTAESNATTVASELLVGQDYNGTTIGIKSTYVPALNAGVQDGKILIEFVNGRVQAPVTGLHLYNYTQKTEVGKNPVLSGANSQKLIFDINGSINDADKIAIANTDTNLSSQDVNASVVLDLLADNTSFSMKYSLLDNTDQERDASSAASILSTKQEWSVAIGTVYDNQIDATSGFLSFSDSKTNDVASIKITKTAVGVSSGSLTLNEVITVDNNISAFATSWAKDTGGAVTLNSDLQSDQNNTYAATYENNVTFTPDGTNEIEVTNFKIALSATKTANNSKFTTNYVSATDKNFGDWDIYGYNAQIPSASYAPSNGNDTVVTVVNTGSSTTTEAFVTIIDADNNECKLNSADNASVAKPIPGGAHKYRLSTMLAETACTALSGTGYAIEISVPTTPTDIYSNANVVNAETGGKMLPVYNNGNSF